MTNPYHKPAGFYKPIKERSISDLTSQERFVLMFGKNMSEAGEVPFLRPVVDNDGISSPIDDQQVDD